MTKVVFDIGGTYMRVAEAERDGLRNILKVPTPSGKQDGLLELLTAIRQVARGEVEKVVGGMAGVISKNGAILKSPNLPGWDGCDMAGFLKENLTGDVLIYNDALMAGLGEAVSGAGKDVSIVAYIGLGTGVGGSRIVNKTLDSATGFEPGHQIIELSTLASWEQRISGHVLTEKYSQYPQQKLKDEVYQECIHTIAVGTYNIILLWSPDIVIIGGSLITGQNAFGISDIARKVAGLNDILPVLPSIRQSVLGDDAGLYGAASLL